MLIQVKDGVFVNPALCSSIAVNANTNTVQFTTASQSNPPVIQETEPFASYDEASFWLENLLTSVPDDGFVHLIPFTNIEEDDVEFELDDEEESEDSGIFEINVSGSNLPAAAYAKTIEIPSNIKNAASLTNFIKDKFNLTYQVSDGLFDAIAQGHKQGYVLFQFTNEDKIAAPKGTQSSTGNVSAKPTGVYHINVSGMIGIPAETIGVSVQIPASVNSGASLSAFINVKYKKAYPAAPALYAEVKKGQDLGYSNFILVGGKVGNPAYSAPAKSAPATPTTYTEAFSIDVSGIPGVPSETIGVEVEVPSSVNSGAALSAFINSKFNKSYPVAPASLYAKMKQGQDSGYSKFVFTNGAVASIPSAKQSGVYEIDASDIGNIPDEAIGVEVELDSTVVSGATLSTFINAKFNKSYPAAPDALFAEVKKGMDAGYSKFVLTGDSEEDDDEDDDVGNEDVYEIDGSSFSDLPAEAFDREVEIPNSVNSAASLNSFLTSNYNVGAPRGLWTKIEAGQKAGFNKFSLTKTAAQAASSAKASVAGRGVVEINTRTVGLDVPARFINQEVTIPSSIDTHQKLVSYVHKNYGGITVPVALFTAIKAGLDAGATRFKLTNTPVAAASKSAAKSGVYEIKASGLPSAAIGREVEIPASVTSAKQLESHIQTTMGAKVPVTNELWASITKGKEAGHTKFLVTK